MIDIIIADDHPLIRTGVRQLVADAADIVLVGEARDGVELIQAIEARSCNVVLLDIGLPGRDGLSLIREVKSRRPAAAVLMLTMHPGEQYAVRALRSGASGYLTKESAPEELVQAIRTVAAGARYVSPNVAATLAASLAAGEGKPPHEALSGREFAVLCRIGAGKSVSQIADELFLSTNTISTYRARILSKLKLESTVEVIHYVVSRGLNA